MGAALRGTPPELRHPESGFGGRVVVLSHDGHDRLVNRDSTWKFSGQGRRSASIKEQGRFHQIVVGGGGSALERTRRVAELTKLLEGAREKCLGRKEPTKVK